MIEKNYSELLFERWLTENALAWRSIPTNHTPTPDYEVRLSPLEYVIFEVKEINSNHRWINHEVHGAEVGSFIRKRINSSRRQIQIASKQGKPTVLLVFNAYDPIQLQGSEDHDFIHAMYGNLTFKVDIANKLVIDRFYGEGKSLQSKKNTSFSAIGRIMESSVDARVTVTLFENIFAAIPLKYESLPSCIKVVRFL